ncbi:16S rRNA (cytidine1402-2'-O)-methyltransferase [Sulfuritortus calidifontis]|uniref:16S rRNA (Cytidine1402-2'-O)-methyltransferase n=1 Tax=Sulfuritortus calidifontis TaxID=1914471 RepID=A0A4R3JTM4_9PROT|nr:SAM-dependent methyltransferase [Sulfuritortus calidifontis]TCS70866.1 16S rRNA (cytidine1402-2'-O)-methyltransferase [Sulfuritortus calidifontis]
MAGTLYLIPTPLGATELDVVLPEATRRIAAGLTTFVVEHPKTARAFLKQVGTALPIQQLTLLELNEHTKPAELKALLAPLLAGTDVGLISEAGCPAVADPGTDLVRLAHQHGIRVKPLTGPSAILLALMGSGLVGQRFSFHGYLPARPEERQQALRKLEIRAEQDDAAQVFIETPYRNMAMLESILAACRDDTWLCLACDLTLESELVQSRRVADWRGQLPPIERRPCVFLLWRQR